MSVVAASAPGKIVLSGEYAVLDGAPAIAMAIDRRALVRYTPGGSGITCLGAGADGDTRLFTSVAEATGYDAAGRGGFTLDTRAFVADGDGAKLGVGSSAALCVALAALLLRLSGSDADARDAAYAAHERFQASAGSGVDIATSSAGGLVEYRRSGRAVRRLEWPEGLCLSLIWTGVAASTDEMLSKLEPATADVSQLGGAAGEAARAWSSGAAADIVTATAGYAAALAAFDREHGLGIMGGGHERLVAAAQGGTIAYKPCGAGGGDIGVVVGTDARAVDAFVREAEQRGGRRLYAGLDTSGLAVSGVPL